MKNKILKLLIICILFAIISIIFGNKTFAWTPNWNVMDDSTYAGNASTAVTNVIGSAINIMSIIGAGVAIIMLIAVALKYMTESPEGKADVKKTIPNYVIGAVILFAVSGILKLLQMFIDANVNSIGGN